MGHRSFAEAAATVAIATGVQKYDSRFGQSRRGHDPQPWPPTAAQWRCNLTALSQTHNLYFVAYEATIYAYTPRFPSQKLPRKPTLIFTSPPSRPGLLGTLDHRQPHAINNLVVQHLGSEEVVAAVRDDGDVDAFLVRHIVSAIERRAAPDSSIGLDADGVRPIFQSNVGKSAWGLAIHSQARVIAVSANTHSITIFKFGLVSADGEQADGTNINDADATHDRGMDVTHQVLNGTSNIPYISFCNTDDDPHGRWLLTTDISGYCRTIDLHQMQTSQTFRFGGPTGYLASASHDRFNSGWLIMFLDKRSFVGVDDAEAALGLAIGESLPGIKDNQGLWDIGDTVANLSNFSTKFSVAKRRRPRQSERPSSSAADSPDGGVPLDSSSSIGDEELPGAAAADPELDESVTTEAAWDHDRDSDSGESAYYADLDLDDEGTEDTASFSTVYGGKRIYANEPRAFQPHNNLCGDCPCPILHTSVRNVYLLQPSSHRQAETPFTSPTVGFTNALHQLVPSEWAYLNIFERLNMHAYIPAVGIVIIASQKGRALVLALTKLSRKARYPPEMQNPDDPARRKTKYAMRLEHVLPFADQEKAGARPFAPLAGIASGPIQGTEHLAMEKRRWRLMMMYTDHSVLSYEISRPQSKQSDDVETVVV
ncbi:hypothetical protein DOTSEDRAFT_69718 [Dothistroma septosporum NZE10]|uniref:Uncharacterized protein n=1 Tax=Dothistroma septosporum (strain NZE10 / CBS 128990) TaxID=675120 RepID=N1PWH5_DOTSN|nr:hypothetical protein DOTSEDRAFT_69718 [Dothistroma septosporum NZE10]